ncbi:hypothetical protein [Nostoc sphaeroides]|uniref:Uncharacterized protein n=1 Tax=Nostoc sphaeroides CCNUC1 TaxID=2653204 RepID=A0A5P8VRT4_9NOSO|nr:hypothetical protein [Nostoc sphaeroides]QFS43060.1 hypothetical protein GXM_00533 [Nostoc sphaeroides CCNUC1]
METALKYAEKVHVWHEDIGYSVTYRHKSHLTAFRSGETCADLLT